jgi:Holliday junction resolvase
MAKKVKATLANNSETTEKKRRSLKNNRRRGNDYERQIAKELRDLGFSGVVTSRSESKAMDDKKIDLIDKEDKLPFYTQIKRCIKYPNYIDIRNACPLKDKEFVLF